MAGGVILHPEAHIEQRRDATFDANPTIGRLVDPGQNREKGRFSGAVAADERDMIAGLELAADLSQRMNQNLMAGAGSKATRWQELRLQGTRVCAIDRKIHRYPVQLDQRHLTSDPVGDARAKAHEQKK